MLVAASAPVSAAEEALAAKLVLAKEAVTAADVDAEDCAEEVVAQMRLAEVARGVAAAAAMMADSAAMELEERIVETAVMAEVVVTAAAVGPLAAEAAAAAKAEAAEIRASVDAVKATIADMERKNENARADILAEKNAVAAAKAAAKEEEAASLDAEAKLLEEEAAAVQSAHASAVECQAEADEQSQRNAQAAREAADRQHDAEERVRFAEVAAAEAAEATEATRKAVVRLEKRLVDAAATAGHVNWARERALVSNQTAMREAKMRLAAHNQARRERKATQDAKIEANAQLPRHCAIKAPVPTSDEQRAASPSHTLTWSSPSNARRARSPKTEEHRLMYTQHGVSLRHAVVCEMLDGLRIREKQVNV